ncbi:MAG: hypothetical protein DWQ01_06510 [Planctomycetota bacterium]|nr:MAG: hypothetical protein DWQ01_06510 [Planctomycetota bacterium]
MLTASFCFLLLSSLQFGSTTQVSAPFPNSKVKLHSVCDTASLELPIVWGRSAVFGQGELLAMDPKEWQHCLKKMNSLEQAKLVSLPSDGRLLISWDKQSLEVKLHMAFRRLGKPASAFPRHRLVHSRKGDPPSSSKKWEELLGTVPPPLSARWWVTEVQSWEGALPANVEATESGILTVRREAWALFENIPKNKLRSQLRVADSEDSLTTWIWFETKPEADGGD